MASRRISTERLLRVWRQSNQLPRVLPVGPCWTGVALQSVNNQQDCNVDSVQQWDVVRREDTDMAIWISKFRSRNLMRD